jgi:hypothetical protein
MDYRGKPVQNDGCRVDNYATYPKVILIVFALFLPIG